MEVEEEEKEEEEEEEDEAEEEDEGDEVEDNQYALRLVCLSSEPRFACLARNTSSC